MKLKEATIIRLVAFVAAVVLIFLGRNIVEVVVGVGIMLGVLVSLEQAKDNDDGDDSA